MFNLLLIIVVLGEVLGVAKNNDTKQEKIKALEKQKNELFLQINDAIDESVKALLQANETEAITGLNYLKDLKEHITELNNTDVIPEGQGIEVDYNSELENRRTLKGLQHYVKYKQPKNSPFDFESVLRPKKISPKEWKEMMTNRITMQKQLDAWIEERKKEKERYEKYKLERKKLYFQGKYEKCPRFGYARTKKRNKEENKEYQLKRCRGLLSSEELCPNIKKSIVDIDLIELKETIPRKYKYPCCRKCCKKSYMGCL